MGCLGEVYDSTGYPGEGKQVSCMAASLDVSPSLSSSDRTAVMPFRVIEAVNGQMGLQRRICHEGASRARVHVSLESLLSTQRRFIKSC